MSDLNPKGIEVELGGVKRHILFTLNVIDEVQSHYNLVMSEILDKLASDEDHVKTLIYLLTVLCNDEADRERFRNKDSQITNVMEKEIGWYVDVTNDVMITSAILRAYGLSLPTPEEENPNLESGQQSS